MPDLPGPAGLPRDAAAVSLPPVPLVSLPGPARRRRRLRPVAGRAGCRPQATAAAASGSARRWRSRRWGCARGTTRATSRDGSPGGAALPGQWGNRYERTGRAVPVEYADEPAFRRWCATAAAVLRPDQVNLRGLHPLLRAEIQWGMCWHTRRQHGKWELAPIQRLADYGRARGLRSLTDLDPGDPGLRKAAGREGARIACSIAGGLHPLYVTPGETREAGYILTEHFGRKLSNRPGRIDLDRISQRWLRDLVWDHFADVLRSPSCPRSGSTFDHTRRAGLELSAFLELAAPGGGHDPRVLTAGHMHKFAADQRQRELDGLTSLGARGVHGKPSIVTANTRQAVFHRTRRLLRGALESGEAEPARPGPGLHHRDARRRPGDPADACPVHRRGRPGAGRRGQPAGPGTGPRPVRPRPAGRLGDDHRHRPPLQRGPRAPPGLPGPLRRPAHALARPDQGRQLRRGDPHPRADLPDAGGPPAQDPGPVPGAEQPAAHPRGTRCDGAVPHDFPQPRLPARPVLQVVPQGLQELDRQPRHRPPGAPPGPPLPGHQPAARRGQPDPHPPLPRPCLRENGGALRPPCPV